jgi:TPR repeat protein
MESCQAHLDKALQKYKKAMKAGKMSPKDLAALTALGLVYHELGNSKQAVVWYKKVGRDMDAAHISISRVDRRGRDMSHYVIRYMPHRVISS